MGIRQGVFVGTTVADGDGFRSARDRGRPTGPPEIDRIPPRRRPVGRDAGYSERSAGDEEARHAQPRLVTTRPLRTSRRTACATAPG